MEEEEEEEEMSNKMKQSETMQHQLHHLKIYHKKKKQLNRLKKSKRKSPKDVNWAHLSKQQLIYWMCMLLKLAWVTPLLMYSSSPLVCWNVFGSWECTPVTD